MKMAKADKQEWERVMKFAQELEEEIKYPEKTDEELGRWVRKAPCLFRVVFGYEVIVDNACDPDSDTLEFKPEIAEAMEFYQKSKARAQDNSQTKDDAPIPKESVSHPQRSEGG